MELNSDETADLMMGALMVTLVQFTLVGLVFHLYYTESVIMF